MSAVIKLARKNLARRRSRTALTILGVATALFILVAVESLSDGLGFALSGSDAARTLIVYRQNRYCPQTSFLPERYASKIAEVEGVASVLPVKIYLNNCRASLDLVAFHGAPVEELLRNRNLDVIDGDAARFREQRNAALVGRAFAERRGLGVGDEFRFGAINVNVAGVFASSEPTQENVVMTHLEYLQRAAGVQRLGTVTMFEVKVTDAARAKEIGRKIDALFKTAEEPTDTRSMISYLESSTRDLRDLLNVGRILAAVAVLVVLVLVANTVLMSSNERRSEFGVLMTLGYRGSHLFALVLVESLMLSLAGGVLGVGAAALTVALTKFSIGVEGVSVVFRVSWQLIGTGLVVVTSAALLAGLVPAARAARADPVASLRGA